MTAKLLLKVLVLVPGFVGAIGFAAVAGVPSEQVAKQGTSTSSPVADVPVQSSVPLLRAYMPKLWE